MKKNFMEFLNEKGQTAVEYLLLIAILVTLLYSVLGLVKKYMLGDEDCPNESLYCKLLDASALGDLSRSNFRYYALRKPAP